MSFRRYAAAFERDVLPRVPDAWIDNSKTKKGYEIPFNRHFVLRLHAAEATG